MWGNGYYGDYPMMGEYGDFGVFHILSSIFWVFVAVMLIIMAVRALRGKPMLRCRRLCGGMGSSSALELLSERYAKGEINKEEYEERKKVLSA